VLFALSRNRPDLAPNIGSLPELREQVGRDWVYLYDGEFNQGVLTDFLAWMRETKRGEAAPLDSYAWSRIGRLSACGKSWRSTVTLGDKMFINLAGFSSS
jgi:hypothetical protein